MMNVCDPIRLSEYLQGDLSPQQMEAVESHLCDCSTCRQRLELEAAPAGAWSRAQAMLEHDELDGPITRFDYPATMTEESGDSTDRSLAGSFDLNEEGTSAAAINADMVTREISGWLDPTDDPQMLGRFAGYEIVGVVGHGEMGIVLKGFEPSLNRFVAIKAMAPRLATSEAARKRFAREAQATAAVLHENVVAIHRVDKSHGLPFLVMPYLGGESLQRRIDKQGPLGVEPSLQIASQIAAGLAAAHARGLIHRDIKPANILLQQGVQRVTITDFGLARAADETSVTRTGIIAGTPPYMSPEQARARPLDGRSDLFSLGSVLYTMLSGRLPFHGETNHAIVEHVAAGTAPPLAELDPELPPWVIRLVEWLHAKAAEARPESAAEVQRIIDRCLLHLRDPNEALPEALRDPPKRSGNSRTWRLAIAATGVVVLVAVVSWFPPRSPQPDRITEPARSSGDVSEQTTATPITPEVMADVSASELAMESFDTEMSEIETSISALEESTADFDAPIQRP